MIIRAYLHSTRESMRSLGEESGLTGEALDNFTYELYEVAFDLEVDPTTGDARIVAVDGRPLPAPGGIQ